MEVVQETSLSIFSIISNEAVLECDKVNVNFFKKTTGLINYILYYSNVNYYYYFIHTFNLIVFFASLIDKMKKNDCLGLRLMSPLWPMSLLVSCVASLCNANILYVKCYI